MKKSDFGWLEVALVIVIISSVIMISLYFYQFNGALSNNVGDWGDFGSYVSSVMSLLAVGGVLMTVRITQKQNTENSERDSFFKLLDLHNSKIGNIEREDKKGAEALNDLVEDLDMKLIHLIVYKFIEGLQEDENSKEQHLIIANKKINKFSNDKDLIFNLINNYPVFNGDNATGLDKWDRIQAQLTNGYIYARDPLLANQICSIIITNYPLDIDDIFDYLRITSNAMAREWGYVTEDYFRNQFYTFKLIKEFKQSNIDDYQKILRAQISQPEAVLNLYNAMGSNSSATMIEYLKEYKVFRNIYSNEVLILKLSTTPDILDQLLAKSSNKLKSEGRL